MVEMNEKGVAGYRYILKKISPGETNLSVQMLIKNNPLFKIAFAIAIRSKMMKRIRDFFIALKGSLRKEEVSAMSL
jgi:hypothetical protein